MNSKENTLYLSPEQELKSEGAAAVDSGWTTGLERSNKSRREGTQQPAASQSPKIVKPSITASTPEPRTSPQHRKPPAANLHDAITHMAELIANITESYSVVIFLADKQKKSLRLGGYHTLSREFAPEISIGFGSGLVGWTAENKVRISVCPFERDASTLLYYTADQDLKSFIAIPILSAGNNKPQELLGVIACDSKKSYAYAKLTEKILLECAAQVAVLLELFAQLGAHDNDHSADRRQEQLAAIIESLRGQSSEESLLGAVASLPESLVERDALVVVTTSDGGVGGERFYPPSARNIVEQRLWERICKHKKVSGGRRSVHAKPLDDSKQRSFLSIPLRVLEREAGSLNLLSKPHAAFTPEEITTLERIAEVTGSELERLRLKQSAEAGGQSDGILPWKLFCVKAKSELLAARAQKSDVELLRLSFGRSFAELEQNAGIGVAAAVASRIARLVDQVAQPNAVVCALPNSDYLLLCANGEGGVLASRLERLLARLAITDFTKDRLLSDIALGSFLRKSLCITSARYPQHGETVDQLVEHCRRAKMVEGRGLAASEEVRPIAGEVANAGNWQ